MLLKFWLLLILHHIASSLVINKRNKLYLSYISYTTQRIPYSNNSLWATSKVGGKVIGFGHASPQNEIENDHLQKYVNTSDEWIKTRTGIKKRRILKQGENLSTLQIEAAKKALTYCSLDPKDVHMIINASSTPQNLFGDASNISKHLGCKNSVNMDLTAACTGFVFAFVTAYNFLPKYKNILVVGSDAMSHFVDWRDRNTCVLFGDAAGAVVLQRMEHNETEETNDNVYSYYLGSNSELNDLLSVNFNNEKYNLDNPNTNKYGTITMNGKEVYKYAVSNIPEIVKKTVEESKIQMSDINYFIFHQANIRIIQATAKALDIPMSKVLINLDEYANTSAASIPLCLSEHIYKGVIKKNDIICMCGFGAGMSYGCVIFKY